MFLKKRKGIGLLITAALSSIVIMLTAQSVATVYNSQFSALDASRTALQTAQLAEVKASELRVTSYSDINSKAQTRAAVSSTNFEREVVVGAETDIGGGNKQKIATVNVYKPGESQPRFSLPVPLSSQGSGVFGAYNVWNDVNWMKFHWNGQSGQPSWLWGGNSASDMYLYNPSNFSVNYANTAGYATNAGNANTVGGYTAAQLIAAAQSGITAGNTVAVLTGTMSPSIPGFITLPLPSGYTEAQCKFFWYGTYGNDPYVYTTAGITRNTNRTDLTGVYIVIGVK